MLKATFNYVIKKTKSPVIYIGNGYSKYQCLQHIQKSAFLQFHPYFFQRIATYYSLNHQIDAMNYWALVPTFFVSVLPISVLRYFKHQAMTPRYMLAQDVSCILM